MEIRELADDLGEKIYRKLMDDVTVIPSAGWYAELIYQHVLIECSRLASRVEELERIVGDMFTLLDQCCDSEDWREWVARWRADAVSVLAGAHAEEKE